MRGSTPAAALLTNEPLPDDVTPEGRLAELIQEIGWSAEFDAVADSGRLGIEKFVELTATAPARLPRSLLEAADEGDPGAALERVMTWLLPLSSRTPLPARSRFARLF